MRFILFGLITVLLSCASEPLPTVKDDRVVPFYRRYMKKDKEIIYVVVDYQDQIDHETKRLLDNAIRKFDPEILLARYSAEEALDLEDFSGCEEKDHCSTALWTCQFAKRKGVPCVTGEPFHTELLKESVKLSKTTNNDILFYYVYRSVVQDSGKNKDPLRNIDQLIEKNKNLLNLHSDFDRNDFNRIFKEKMNRPMVVINPKNLEVNSSGNYIQRLAFAVDKSYHSLLFTKINKSHVRHKRIMVVYQLSVFEKQESALEEYFSGHIP